jgi:hypothetical protein
LNEIHKHKIEWKSEKGRKKYDGRKIPRMIMHKVGSRNHYASEMDVLIEH